jgi:hypothetical protein
MPNSTHALCALTFCTSLLQGCIATLPDIVGVNDADIFKHERAVNEQEARSCGSHLNKLRSSAQTNNYFRLGTTIAAGSVTTVSSFLVATKEEGDSAKTEAYVALVGGLVTILAQAIPDPTAALDDHRKARSAWSEARRRVANGTPADDGGIFGLLSDCRANRPYEGAPAQTVTRHNPAAPGEPGDAPRPGVAPSQPVTPARNQPAARPEPPAPVAAWYGFEKSKNKDQESNLKAKCDPNFQRVDVPEGTKTFTGLCTSLGMRCSKVCDWEGATKGCDDLPSPQWSGDGPDGSRVGYCVP